MTADQIIEGILGKEGGYVDHPSDKGGPTRWGITQTTARAHGYTGDMRNLPRETAKQILLSDYWTGPRFDQVASLSTLLADELCDTGVNMGPSVASKFFQRWLTALNMRGKLYPNLIPDGAIGPRTITALKGYLSARGKRGTGSVTCAELQPGRQIPRTGGGPRSQRGFLYGWVKERVM